MWYDTVMKSRELVKVLKQNGWTLIRVKGSHHIFKHQSLPNLVVVPIHGENADVPTGTLNDILKKAGLK